MQNKKWKFLCTGLKCASMGGGGEGGKGVRRVEKGTFWRSRKENKIEQKMTIEALKAGFRKNVDVDNSKKFLTKKASKFGGFNSFLATVFM